MDGQTITLIVLGILVLAALVFAFLASKKWHWGQVVLVTSLFFAALGFLLLAKESLRMRAIAAKLHADTTAELEELEDKIEALRYGTTDTNLQQSLASQQIQARDGAIPGTRRLQSELTMLTTERGRVWRFVGRPPNAVDPAAGTVRVVGAPRRQVEGEGQPAPAAPPLAGLEEGMVVFAFEMSPQNAGNAPGGSQYLGEFRVAQAGGQGATLVPVLRQSWQWPVDAQPDPRVLRMAQSKAPWALYEIMPTDSHAALAGISQEELKNVMPPSVAEEYARHGEPAEANAPGAVAFDTGGLRLTDEEVEQLDPAAVEWRYERQLRDYDLYFQQQARQRVEMFAERKALLADSEAVQAIIASATAIQQKLEQRIAGLESDLEGFSYEASVVQQYQQAVADKLRETRLNTEKQVAQNSQLANQLVMAQQAITKQLDGVSTPQGATGATQLQQELEGAF